MIADLGLDQGLLERTPLASDLTGWVAEIDSGRMTRKQAARRFVESDEYVHHRSPWKTLVALAHAGFLHRAATRSELDAWSANLALLHPPTELVQSLITADEYLARSGG